MKKSLLLVQTRILIVLLATLTTVWAQTQPTEHGYDDDQSVKTSQRDNEKHETELGWIGFFGLLGAVGVVGPDRMAKRRSRVGGPARTMNLLMVGSLGLALSVALWTLTPALAQTKPDDTGQHGASVSNSDKDEPAIPNIGWVGLLGLIGLLGLRRGRSTAKGDSDSDNAGR